MKAFIIAVTLIFSSVVFSSNNGYVKYIINIYDNTISWAPPFYLTKIAFTDPTKENLDFEISTGNGLVVFTKYFLIKYNMALNALQPREDDRAIICQKGLHYGIGFSGDNFLEIFNAKMRDIGEKTLFTKCSEPKSINLDIDSDPDFTIMTIKFKDADAWDFVEKMYHESESEYHIRQMLYNTVAKAMEINEGGNLVLSEDGETLSIKEKDITLGAK